MIYAVAIPTAFALQWISLALYVIAAMVRLIPGRRIERAVGSDEGWPSGAAKTGRWRRRGMTVGCDEE